MHQAMNPYEPSACPLCRTKFAHFPRVCPRLHALLQAGFPEAYARRAVETEGECLGWSVDGWRPSARRRRHRRRSLRRTRRTAVARLSHDPSSSAPPS